MFEHLLTDTIYVSYATGTTAYGDLTYGDYVEVKAALERGFSKIVDTDGNETTSSASCATAIEIPLNARVILNAADVGDNTKARQPIAVTSCPSRISGVFYYETFF